MDTHRTGNRRRHTPSPDMPVSAGALALRDLTVAYDGPPVIRAVDLGVDPGEVVCIIGPSGSGKSTLLRAIAGLQPPSTGTVVLDGVDITNRRPDRRGIGMMFQDHALFPHRTVADNVAFGPRMHGLDRTLVVQRVREVLDLVDLGDAANRSVTTLSGGEQQRVALARAIATRPSLLMLDEPLGSLDRALRNRLLDELPRLLRTVGTTVLYVTHDQDEALALADRLVVMRDGVFVQQGDPLRLWREPADVWVARFLGLDQIVSGQVEGGTLTTPIGAWPVGDDLPDGERSVVLLADSLRLSTTGPDRDEEATVSFTGVVVGRRLATDHLRVDVRTNEGIQLRVPVRQTDFAGEVGTPVVISLDPRATHLVDPDPERGG